MSHEEMLARSHGPALSLARSIYLTKDIPAIGQDWTVEVHVVQFEDESRKVLNWIDFSFEIQITAELLAVAMEVMNHVTKRRARNAWMVLEGNFLVGVKEDDSVERAFRTTDEDIEELVKNLSEACEDANAKRRERWLLSYFATCWNPHIPVAASKDTYRGICHGLRLAIDAFRFLIPSVTPTQDLSLLAAVLIDLAGLSAERYLGTSIEQSIFSRYRLGEQFPDALMRSRLAPFQIDAVEAECWATASLDTSRWKGAIPFSDQGHLARLPPAGAYAFIESGDTQDFYLGTLYGLQLCGRVFKLFREKIFSTPSQMLFDLEGGMDQMSNTAAQLWREASRTKRG